jgi:hypothetical protein
MTKIRRTTAAALVSLVAVGLLGLPAIAAEAEQSVEDQVCASVAPQREDAVDALEASVTELDEQAEALVSTQSALFASSTALGNAGLAYLRALDGDGNERTTEANYTAAAAQYAEDLTEFIEASQGHDAALKAAGVNAALLNYLSAVCPAPAPSPSPSETE